jgi:hypothetical protein
LQNNLRIVVLLVIASALTVAFIACSSGDSNGAVPAAAEADPGEVGAVEDGSGESSIEQQIATSITFTSPVFNETRRIPKKSTCSEERPPPDGAEYGSQSFADTGENLSPPLDWSDVPEGTASFALIMDSTEDLGAPWTHWVIWNIPPDAAGLPEDVQSTEELPDGSRQGVNSGRTIGYLGPCPLPQVVYDSGRASEQGAEKYNFHLYALDKMLDLAPGATKEDLLGAIDGHILAAGELVGERVGKKLLKIDW